MELPEKLVLFIIASVPVTWLSWKPLRDPKSHGFFRYFSWECILWLLISNYSNWMHKPFSSIQILSWILLFSSALLALAGFITMKRHGSAVKGSGRQTQYGFEQTTRLVNTGIFRHIRHPMYASLILFTWGVYLKNPDILLTLVSLASTVLLYITAKVDEKECLEVFGEEYRAYMRVSKMFVPYLF